MAYCSSLPLNHSLKLSIPVTIYLPPQFIQHFFHCFFNPLICIFSQCQCQRKFVYNIPCGQFSGIASPHFYRNMEYAHLLQSCFRRTFFCDLANMFYIHNHPRQYWMYRNMGQIALERLNVDIYVRRQIYAQYYCKLG